MADVVVIGAGLSGLACGWELARRGVDAVVLERSDMPGGVVRTHLIDGFLVESGPNSILPTPGAFELILTSGLGEQLLTAPKGLPRFVYVGGRLRKVPWVLSPGGFLRAMGEPLVGGRPRPGDESIGSFFTRRFGPQVVDRLVGPFVGGIYAGDPAELGIEGTFPRLAELERRYGSVILGLLRSGRGARRFGLCSFRDGMAALPRMLAAGTDVRCQEGAVSVARNGNRWRVESEKCTREARAVVLALPAHQVGGCFPDPALGGLLGQVEYAPVLVAAAALDEDQFARVPDGFGLLVPRTEGLRILGTLFSSAVFPARAPEGKVLLTSFLGGRLDRESPGWPDERVWETLGSDLAPVLGFTGGLRRLGLWRYSRGIPQYRVGHRAWRREVELRLAALPGLFLAGNYLDGVSVPATLDQGRARAAEVQRYLEGRDSES
jgi:oxygen-dependent protoporphyrinogen oxidase